MRRAPARLGPEHLRDAARLLCEADWCPPRDLRRRAVATVRHVLGDPTSGPLDRLVALRVVEGLARKNGVRARELLSGRAVAMGPRDGANRTERDRGEFAVACVARGSGPMAPGSLPPRHLRYRPRAGDAHEVSLARVPWGAWLDSLAGELERCQTEEHQFVAGRVRELADQARLWQFASVQEHRTFQARCDAEPGTVADVPSPGLAANPDETGGWGGHDTLASFEDDHDTLAN